MVVISLSDTLYMLCGLLHPGGNSSGQISHPWPFGFSLLAKCQPWPPILSLNEHHRGSGTPGFSFTGNLHLLGIPKARVWGWWRGEAEEAARHLRSLSGGPYHSRICLPPGSGPDAHTSHAAAATLLCSCYTGCGQDRCRFRRLGGRAHILPSPGRRRSQGHSSSRSCRLRENTEWRHETQPWLSSVIYAGPSSKQAGGRLRNIF